MCNIFSNFFFPGNNPQRTSYAQSLIELKKEVSLPNLFSKAQTAHYEHWDISIFQTSFLLHGADDLLNDLIRDTLNSTVHSHNWSIR